MQIVLGVLTSLLMEGIKRMSNKWGKTMTEGIILGGLFIIILVGTGLTQTHIISEKTIEFIIQTFTVSITTYELVIKKIIPFLEKFNQQ